MSRPSCGQFQRPHPIRANGRKQPASNGTGRPQYHFQCSIFNECFNKKTKNPAERDFHGLNKMSYLRLRNFNKSSLRNPASRSIAKSVPLGRSFGWRGTTARLFVAGFRKTKWLPVAWSSMKPFVRRNAITVRDVILGSRGMSEVERRKEGLGIGWNRLAMLFQAFNVRPNGIVRHCFCFTESSAVRNASSERWDDNRISPLWFRPENDMIMRKFCFHGDAIIASYFLPVNSVRSKTPRATADSQANRTSNGVNRTLTPAEIKRLYNMGR